MQGGMGMGGAQWSKGGVSGMPAAQYLGCSFKKIGSPGSILKVEHGGPGVILIGAGFGLLTIGEISSGNTQRIYR